MLKGNNIEMTNTKNRLLNVILINSYPKGQIYKLNVDNNTIITGRNASGKTTLMGAIAPFYGVLLSNIARKSDVKKSFLEFYLPTDKSYLVYEYLKDNQVFSVLLRNANNSPVFHLINGAYQQDDFVTSQSNGIYFNHFNQVKTNVKNRNLEISNNLSQAEYEAIISNCPMGLLKDYHKDAQTNIRKYRHDFALVSDKKGSFYGFAPIAHNVLQSKLEFNEICKFLVEAMQKQGMLQGYAIGLNTQGINTQLWVNQRQTWQKIEALKPKFDELNQLLADNQNGQRQLYQTLQSTLAFSVRLDEQLTLLSEQKQHADEQLSDLDYQITQLELDFNRESGLLQNQIENVTQKITQLEKQKLIFEQGDNHFLPINILQNWLKERPLWRSERLQKIKQRDILQEQFKEIQVEIDKIRLIYSDEVRRIETLYNENKEILNTQEKQNFQQNQIQKEKVSDYFIKQKDSQDKHFANQLANLQQAKKQVELQQQDLKTRLNSTGYSDTFTQQIEQNLSKQTQFDSRIKQQKQLVVYQQTLLDQIDNTINQKLDEQKTLNDESNRLNHEKSNLQALSQDNTLYSFLLRSEIDNPLLARPIEHIHKTINAELLSRKDLQPNWQFDEERVPTVFGLSIDTGHLTMGEQKSLQEIHAQIGEKDERILQITEDLQKLEHELAQLLKKQNNAKQNLQKEQFAEKQLEKSRQQLKDDFEQIRLSADKDKSERKQQLEKELQEIKLVIESHDEKISNTELEQKNQRQALEKEKANQIAILREQFDNEQVRINHEFEQLAEQHKHNIQEAEIKKDKAIADKGFDQTELLIITEHIQKLEDKIEQANQGEARVRQYDNFLADEYEHISAFRQQKQEISQTKEQQKTVYDQQQQQASKQKSQLQMLINDKKETLGQLRQDLDRLQKSTSIANQRIDHNLFKTIDIDIMTNIQNISSAQDINTQNLAGSDWHLMARQTWEQLERETQEAKKTTELGRSLVSMLKSPFSGQGFSTEVLNDAYTEMTSDTNWYVQGQSLQDYMTHEHENRKQLIIQNYKTQAERVNNFKGDIDQIHLALNSFTSQINRSCKSICQDLTHLAIEDFSMNIHSSIRDNEWYPILDEFANLYQTWKNSQFNRSQESLPDDTLLASLEKVQNYIGQNNLTVEFTKQFSIDLIVKQYGEKPQVAKGSQSFKELSSNGTIRIAQLIIYLSLLHMISTCQDVQLKLFIDEIGVLDEQNTKELLEILQKNHISAMCASPEVVHEAVIPLFANNIACRHDKNNVYDFSQIDDVLQLSMDSKLENYGCFDL